MYFCFLIASELDTDSTQLIRVYDYTSIDFAVEQIRRRSPLVVASTSDVARTAKWRRKLNPNLKRGE